MEFRKPIRKFKIHYTSFIELNVLGIANKLYILSSLFFYSKKSKFIQEKERMNLKGVIN